MMLLMSLYSGAIYASENEGYNIEIGTTNRNGKEVEVLRSKDGGYLQITQIGQNSQNVKITTSTFDEKILIAGKVQNKGTTINIEVYKGEECTKKYSTTVGITETFSQNIELAEGENKVFIYYKNGNDGTDNYVTIYIRRESAESMEKLKSYLDVPSL